MLLCLLLLCLLLLCLLLLSLFWFWLGLTASKSRLTLE